MNGVWIGTRKPIIQTRLKGIRQAPTKETGVFRVAAHGGTKSRHHALPTEAVCRRNIGTRTMVSEW